MNDAGQTPLDSARAALDRARREREALLAQVAAANAALFEASRLAGQQDQQLPGLRARRDELTRQWTESHATVRGAQELVSRAIGGLLRDDPNFDFVRLSTQYPIVFLPVRIETRFDITPGRPPVLKIRVYPDEIIAQGHEPGLTADELAAGRDYWQAATPAGETVEAWRILMAGRSSQRAAWIARVTAPGQPEPAARPSTWSRALEAHVLPDRWVALAYRGNVLVHQAVSSALVEPLALTIDPHPDPADRVPISDDLRLPSEFLWTIDFDRAVKAGMGFEMLLDPSDLPDGFDRLLVFGVKSSLDPTQASERLAGLIENHHYTRGMAFVHQGTPTNNTSNGPSGYPPPDPNGERSFAIERGAPLATPDADGSAFMRALGLPVALADHLDGAQLTEQRSARAMNEAMWPVTLGYFLQNMMHPVLNERAQRDARVYFVDRVRARGHLPAFRVGSTPYGLLPVSSLTRWRPDQGATGVDVELPALLMKVRDIWQAGATRAPQVGLTADPDADLATILAMDASARELAVRITTGVLVYMNILLMNGFSPDPLLQSSAATAAEVLAAIGHPEWVLRVTFLQFRDAAGKFKFPFVTDRPLSETDPLQPNYIRDVLASSEIFALRARLSAVSSPPFLLFRLLNQGMLLAAKEDALDLLIEQNLALPTARIEQELHGIAVTATATPTVWEHFDTQVATVTGSRTVGQFVLSNVLNPFNAGVQRYRQALGVLADLPTAELERLLTETLDVCSHRLDAWISSLPAARLERMRERRPTGTHLGAFAWVENLRPLLGRRRTPVTLPDGQQLFAQTDSGGYIHAPSMSHASAAAVLRNAFISNTGGDRRPYEIDLSSERVRTGRWMFDSMRLGQPVTAILGYAFERELHEVQLDKYIATFRQLFPIATNTTRDSGLPVEGVAARDVVDGLALRNAWAAKRGPFAPGGQVSTFPPADRAAIDAQLGQLEVIAESGAHLLLAESVYQLVRSNTFAAVSSLDAAAGAHPPDPEVVQQPRGGTSLTHRFGMVLGEPAGAVGPGWPAATSPRAEANPYLDAWVASLLGDPRTVTCQVNGAITVTLAELDLRPLDVLALARNVLVRPLESELDRRVADVVLPTVATAISYAPQPGDGPQIRTFPEILEVAQAINGLLRHCRPLRAEDFVLPQELGRAKITPSPSPDASIRATQARTQLAALKTALDLAVTNADLPALRTALRRASLFGLGQSYPVADDSGLLEQADPVQQEIDRRVEEATAATDPTEIVHVVLGRDVVFLTPFQPPFPTELDLALGQGKAGLQVDQPTFKAWLHQVWRVRPALAAWRKVALYAGALGTTATDFDLAQLPFVSNARWVGLPFAPESARPTAGHLSLVLHRPQQPAAAQPWFGLFIDDWTETIPSIKETTGIGFHFDDTSAEAAQAILLAVPPTDAQAWDLLSVADILNETLDLAKIRAVDLELIGKLGQILPAIYLPVNEAEDTISSRFTTAVVDQIRQIRLAGL
jgi:hypothetical protein